MLRRTNTKKSNESARQLRFSPLGCGFDLFEPLNCQLQPREGHMFGNKTNTPKGRETAQPAPAPVAMPAPAAAEAPAPRAPKNYISAGTVIEGNIVSHEDLHLDGTVKGDIKTTGRLILGKESNVEGNILASEAEVSGLITGTVESKGSLTIRATCKIFGDIITKSLNVESGSSFNGRCKVGGEADGPRGEAARPAPAAPAAAPVAARPKV
jgi:cytoskeletal protein CcmA (bactofilin family)